MPSTKRPQVSIDQERFAELASSVVGLPISHAQRGYGSALLLDLGRVKVDRTLPQRSPKGRPFNRRYGEAGVMIEWSWRVERAASIQFWSWSTDRRMDRGITTLPGPLIQSVSVVARLPELLLELSDGRWIQAFMTAEVQPAWVLFLQDGSSLTVERGRLVHNVQNQRIGHRHRAD